MNLSIKNVPDDVVSRLRQRAERNHRSLQGELLTIIESAVAEARGQARTIDINELYAKVQKLGFETPSESAAMIREDRDR